MSGPFGTLLVTPLILACAQADEEGVRRELDRLREQKTLENGLREADDWAGSTPLHWAAYTGSVRIVKLLLAAGANVTAPNTRDKALPLHLAARYNKTTAVISMLAEAAPETVNAVSAKGNTPLHETAYEGRVEAAEILLRMGAQLEAVNHSEGRHGLTPLLAAAQYGHVPLMKKLLEKGASPCPKVDTSAAYDGGFDIVGQPVLSHALNFAQLPCALCLLDHLATRHGFYPPIFYQEELQRIITSIWVAPSTEKASMDLHETVHFFTALVLCTRPQGVPPLVQASDEDDPSDVAAADKINLLLNEQQSAPNPVLVALELASTCRDETARNSRDRVISEQLGRAANLLENVASGVLQGAVKAAIERGETNKTFNPWVTGKRALEPSIARDFFTTSTLNHAAEHELKIYVSNPFIYQHLQDLFLPVPPSTDRMVFGSVPEPVAGAPAPAEAAPSLTRQLSKNLLQPREAIDSGIGGQSRRTLRRLSTKVRAIQHFTRAALLSSRTAPVQEPEATGFMAAACAYLRAPLQQLGTYAALLFLHALVLPMLIFIPRHWELEIEDWLRNQVMTRQLPFGILWFFPAGRLALWSIATTYLAFLITFLEPVPVADFEPTLSGVTERLLSDTGGLMLLLYAAGWVVYEVADLMNTKSRATYFRDSFNKLDLALIVSMLLTCGTRFLTPSTMELTLPCQSTTAMLAWLRLLQMLYIFPSTGPLLIMTLRMFHDLFQFLTLAAFVLVAFAAGFHVLLLADEAQYTRRNLATADDPPTGAAEVLHVSRRVLKGDGGAPYDLIRGEGSISFGSVVNSMLEGTLAGEPDRIMHVFGTDPLVPGFTFGLMVVFGIVFVLLLLNLLIARFAKTFDVIYENVDANFKVAFARVVLKGGAHELVPPPFNLVRRSVLLLYTAIDSVRTMLCATRYAQLPEDTPGAVSGAPSAAGTVTDSSSRTARNEYGMSGEEVMRVYEFLRKASSPEVRLYPSLAEQWTMRHMHDVASEERWRTAITQQLAELHEAAVASSKASTTVAADGASAAPVPAPMSSSAPPVAEPSTAEALHSLDGRINQLSAEMAVVLRELRILGQRLPNEAPASTPKGPRPGPPLTDYQV